MSTGFEKLSPLQLSGNFFELLASDWALLCVDNGTQANCITVSWGGTGVLWGKNVATCFVRPQRFTYPIINSAETFSLCFPGKDYKSALSLCGSKSGRDMDKFGAAGFTEVALDNGGIGIAESMLTLECSILYKDDFHGENFVDKTVCESAYPQKDYHRMFIGEILQCYKRQ